jgi:hypothetical protein
VHHDLDNFFMTCRGANTDSLTSCHLNHPAWTRLQEADFRSLGAAAGAASWLQQNLLASHLVSHGLLARPANGKCRIRAETAIPDTSCCTMQAQHASPRSAVHTISSRPET